MTTRQISSCFMLAKCYTSLLILFPRLSKSCNKNLRKQCLQSGLIMSSNTLTFFRVTTCLINSIKQTAGEMCNKFLYCDISCRHIIAIIHRTFYLIVPVVQILQSYWRRADGFFEYRTVHSDVKSRGRRNYITKEKQCTTVHMQNI